MLKKILDNPAMGYILSRYLTYAIQLINSILIAVYLGPVYLGIWGFISLVLQYLNQLNFGIPHAVQAIAAINKEKENYISKVTGNALVILFVISILLGLIFLFNFLFRWDFGSKYNFSTYAGYIYFIAVLTQFNSLLSNILRVYGRIWEMAISQSLLPLATAAVLIFVQKDSMLMALVYAYALTTLVSTLIFILKLPIRIHLNFNLKLWKIIQQKGWHLFIYNASFYLILISTRSFVSFYYEVKEFGYFTFAFSLANVLILLLDSFSFLIWPKLLNRLSKLSNNDSYKLITEVRNLYLTSTHILLHLGIFAFPYFLMAFPKFGQTYTAFSLIALTIVLFTNSFGYQGLIIARGKEKSIGRLSFAILILNVTLCFIIVNYLHLNYDFVILATLVSYFIYIVFLNIVGRKILQLQPSFKGVLNDAFPVKLLIPFLTSFIFILLKVEYYFFIIPLLLFIGFNLKTLINMITTIRKLVDNRNFFEI